MALPTGHPAMQCPWPVGLAQSDGQRELLWGCHTSRTPHRGAVGASLWITWATLGGHPPHLADANATDAGLQGHRWRTGLPHFTDKERRKSLIYKEVLSRKPSKKEMIEKIVARFSRPLGSKQGRPASVAIARVSDRFRRFHVERYSEHTMASEQSFWRLCVEHPSRGP